MKQLLVGGRLHDVIRKVNKELGKASLGCSIVTENGGERGIAQRFRETLA
jgi:hypothetical protein